jgi:subtilisin family serine protease
MHKTLMPQCLKRLLGAGSLLAVAFSGLLGSVPAETRAHPAAQDGGSFYYYVEGRRTPLTPSLEWVAVLSGDEGFSAQGEILLNSEIIAQSLEEARTIPYPEMTLVPLAPGLSAAALVEGIDAVRGELGSVVSVNPVFQTVDAEMVVTDEFIAAFPSGMSRDEIDFMNASHAVEMVEPILGQANTFVLRVTAGADLDALAMANLYQESGLAEDAAPNFVRIVPPDPAESQERTQVSALAIPNDYYFYDQWALHNIAQYGGGMIYDADIDAPEAWDINTGSASIIIAVIDEGVDLTHEDMSGKLLAGYDATGNGSAGGPWGNDAHGTNVAGLAAARSNNGIGVAGVCQGCMIMPVRIAYSDSYGDWVAYDSWIANGITWAYQSGASILNNSWGGGTEATVINTAISNARTFGRAGKGAVIIFSAGNNNSSSVSYPAYLSTVIAVGASNLCDQRKTPSYNGCNGYENGWGSNYGGALDVSAPGVWLDSTDIMGAAGYNNEYNGNYYLFMNGTSGAAPIVSGVAGLILSYNNNLTSDQVQTILQNTADDVNGGGWDPQMGYGRVNAYRALTEQKPQAFNKIIPANAASIASTSTYMAWGGSNRADFYEYCIDTINNNQCDTGWVDTGTNTSFVLAGLVGNTTYNWQIRAKNEYGYTYANGSSANFWTFTVILPEIDVRGNQISIPDGDMSPALADYTDFSRIIIPSLAVTRTFIIHNTGNVPLTLGGNPMVVVSGAHTDDFTVIVQPVSPVAPGGSTTFTVAFYASDDGVHTATLSIVSNDPDESTYDFSIQGVNQDIFLDYFPGVTR